MKITKLLVLGAMLLVSGSVTHAEIKDGVRVKPTVTVFKDLQIGDTVYLYNVKAQMFFCGANDYLTRASIASTGFKVTFTETENNRWRFEVVAMETLAPEQNDVLIGKQYENDRELTLFTCNYTGSARLTVRCKEIQNDAVRP